MDAPSKVAALPMLDRSVAATGLAVVPHPAHAADFARLGRLLGRPGHFALIIAQSRDATYRDALIAAADATLKPPGARVLGLTGPPDAQALVNRLAEQAGVAALHLVGMEQWLAVDPPGDLLRDLNFSRERLAAVARRPLVLWLDPVQVRALAEQAPDLWAWRAAVLDFVPSAAPTAVDWLPATVSLTLTPTQARARLVSLDAHLRTMPATATTAALLLDAARLHLDLGEWAAAQARAETALATYRNSGDPSGAVAALSLLADVLEATGRYAEAEPARREALALAETGADQPLLADELNELGTLLIHLARHGEAEPLLRRALAIHEAHDGLEHPSVATDLNNLAQLLQATNHLSEAEPLMRRALAIDEGSFEADHPRVATDLNNLAQWLKATNRLAEAEPLMRRALAIDEVSFGANHPKVAIRLNNLAQLLHATNRLVEAEPLQHRMLLILLAFTRETGHLHPSLYAGLVGYRQLLEDQGLRPDAIARQLDAIAVEAGLSTQQLATLLGDLDVGEKDPLVSGKGGMHTPG